MLYAGELALFLGAGVSIGFAPTWHTLARVMAREAKVKAGSINRKKMRGEDLADVFSKIKRTAPDKFDARVKHWLYYRWEKKAGNWASDTLVALGSLMSGTTRGRIETVLTLNFDSILDMY